VTSAHPAPALAPAEREYQREYGADGAAYRDDQCRGMVIGGGSRRDQHHSLTQADATLGQAEGLAPLSVRRRADEPRVGGQLVTGAQAGDEQDEQRQQQAGGGTRRLNASTPAVIPSACAASMTPTASVPPPRSRASGVTTPSGAL
jgi:hypothetical protein